MTNVSKHSTNDHTHISVILDRTGSMESIRDDTIGGFNTFLQEQKEEPGTATLTLVQFDSQDPYEVLADFAPVSDVKELTPETYVPRAATPLLDTLGRGINDLDARLGKMSDAERPSKVIMVVVTDGKENASREFNKKQIETMIKDKQDKNNWQFVYLSADLAAIDEARSMGMHGSASLLFHKTGKGMNDAWKSASHRAAEFRRNANHSIRFKDEDRLHPDDPEKKAE
jgi:hypothetical protein